MFCFFFFFSSRRRHTRSLCDWSSDVCSSDLGPGVGEPQVGGELVGSGLDPPALQQGEQDDDPNSENDAHNGYGRQDLRQRVSSLVLTNVGYVRPYRAHDIFVGAVTSVL